MATDRRVRTKWIMRRRYRRLSDIATAVGLFVGLTIVGFLSFHIGLVVLMPVVGHATWHAYRDLIAPLPG